jgi:hypothetical protein
MGRSGEADRAGADDGNRKIVFHARSFTRFLAVDGSQLEGAQLAAEPWQQFSVR